MASNYYFRIQSLRLAFAPLLALLVLASCWSEQGCPANDSCGNALLEDRWRAVRSGDDHPLRTAVAAAEDVGMPTQRCDEKLFHGKTRKSAAGDWKVRWLNAQRRAAADLGHLFEVRWAADGADPLAMPARDVEDLVSSLSQLAAGGALRFSWALSRDRLVVGVVDDIVELGVGHVNLVTSTDEEVFIAGEGGLNLPSEFPSDPPLTVNFLSGTFTHPIVRKYSPGLSAHQEQWAPVMAEIFAVGGAPARVVLLDHGTLPQHFVGVTSGTGAARQARILADSAAPTERTRQSVCSPASGLEWLRHCVCHLRGAEGDVEHWSNWCNESEPCNIELCVPPGDSNTAKDL